MSQHQTMEEVSVEMLLNRYNLIVPEIQREYVWGKNPNNILTTFFEDLTEAISESRDGNIISAKTKVFIEQMMLKADIEVRGNLELMLNKAEWPNAHLNIGFLYSYKPNYNFSSDTYEDINLIDGQQRITTLFLLLFYFSIIESRKVDFENFFRFDPGIGQLAFDYRVRSLTHSFLIDMVAKINKVEDIVLLKEKNWFLSNYHDDPTIEAIVSGFTYMQKAFPVNGPKYYDFLKSQVRFWHFRTEETFQGEELYITMNSRGQQLADNENIRGKLFEPANIKATGDSELYWSERWEIWQDFFWRHRNKQKSRSNADAGFNEFLRWIQIITMVDKQQMISDDDNEDAPDKKDILKVMQWPADSQYDTGFLNLKEIDLFYNAVKYLFEDFSKDLIPIKKQYKLYTHFDLLSMVWIKPDKPIIQIDLYRLLPVIFFLKKCFAEKKRLDTHNLFRLIRFFNNTARDENVGKSAGPQAIQALILVKRLKVTDDLLHIYGYKARTIINNEEHLKLGLLKGSDVRTQLEDLFWMAEDMEYHRGSIAFLINWTLTETKGVFQFKIFKKMVLKYKQLIDNEDKIRGDLLITRCYQVENERAKWRIDFYKSSDFLQFAMGWYKVRTTILEEFLQDYEKIFLTQYANLDALKAESGLKKQIYIYYLLSKLIMPQRHHEWHWDNGRNFGKLSSWEIEDKLRNFFTTENFVQQYKVSFVLNKRKIIWLQTSNGIGPKKFEKLLEWSRL
jgi:uncharacterized protein with ParB-like and HNH nuclease domain